MDQPFYRRPLPVAGLIVLAILLAYSNCFTAPFTYDDESAILNNTTIRDLGDLGTVLSPPSEVAVGGRPLLNLTFAINYAVSGLRPWSFHLLNLAIHLLAALTLFDLLRHTLQLPLLGKRFEPETVPLAAAITLLWAVHPLQTESVTFISQRSESLMSLCYLLTIYGLLRGVESPKHRAGWWGLSVVFCFVGLAIKEVMVTAPLLAFLYDRTFLAGSFREAWKQRRGFYLALASSWLLLIWLLADLGHRSVGLGYGVTPFSYALTQCHAITLYLAKTAWPHPLLLDYGMETIDHLGQVAAELLFLLVLIGTTALALIRWPAIGFAGAAFFMILAPTSSFIPVSLEPIAEHRVYLPLAPVLALVVLGFYRSFGRLVYPAAAALALIWGVLTFLRNDDYYDTYTLWKKAVADRPNNERARVNYGRELWNRNDATGALKEFEAGYRINPSYPPVLENLAAVHTNFGNFYAAQENFKQAEAEFTESIRLNPRMPEVYYDFGNVLVTEGSLEKAAGQFKKALELRPHYAEAINNLGIVFLEENRPLEALPCFREAARLQPQFPEAHLNLSRILAQLGKRDEAVLEAREALRLNPGLTPARDLILQLGAQP